MISYSTMFLHIACCFCDKVITKNESQAKLVLIFCYLHKKLGVFGLIWFEKQTNKPSSSLSDHFQLWSRLWLQCDAVHALSLALVSHVRIDLCGLNVLVTEHVLNGVDSCTSINLQRAESVAYAVEGDVLGNACSL